VAPALASAGLPALSSLSPRAPSTGTGASARLHALHGAPGPRRGAKVTVAPSGARTERAQTGASFPSALVIALLGLLLAIAMVVVPKLGHRAVPVSAGAVGAQAGVDSGADAVPRPQDEVAARAFRPQVIQMDSAVAPMAADSFSRMTDDADHAAGAENGPRAEDESEDRGDTE
jgi:hypothetical protein